MVKCGIECSLETLDSAIACVFFEKGSVKPLSQYSEYIGKLHSSVAQILCILRVLQLAPDHAELVSICTNDDLSLKMISKKRTRSSNLRPILNEVLKLMRERGIFELILDKRVQIAKELALSCVDNVSDNERKVINFRNTSSSPIHEDDQRKRRIEKSVENYMNRQRRLCG